MGEGSEREGEGVYGPRRLTVTIAVRLTPMTIGGTSRRRQTEGCAAGSRAVPSLLEKSIAMRRQARRGTALTSAAGSRAGTTRAERHNDRPKTVTTHFILLPCCSLIFSVGHTT